MRRRRATQGLPLALLLFMGCNLPWCPPPPPPLETKCMPLPESPGDAGAACASETEREPNDTTSYANRVAPATCATQTFAGRIADDVDVFRTTGTRCDGAQPEAKMDTGAPIQVCLFAMCTRGLTLFQGCEPDGTDGGVYTAPYHLAAGMVGCCRNGAGTVRLAPVRCAGDYSPIRVADPPVDAFVVVKRLEGSECADYTIGYHY